MVCIALCHYVGDAFLEDAHLVDLTDIRLESLLQFKIECSLVIGDRLEIGLLVQYILYSSHMW